MMLRFSKMHGLGNDFVVIDLVTQKWEPTLDAIQKMADRHFGIGFDQLLIVEPPSTPDIDFRYRIFNADGSEVEQCGNGARCFALFVLEEKLTAKRTLKVETTKGIITLHVNKNNWVKVNMGRPRFSPRDIPLRMNDQQSLYELVTEEDGLVQLGAVSMGNPHGVVIVDSVEHAPVDRMGPILENHPDFPNRANIGFMEIINPDQIKLRVFERGVGETLACGTGACAAMAVGRINDLVNKKIKVSLPGGDLEIEWDGEGDLYMTGPAEKVFEGKVRV